MARALQIADKNFYPRPHMEGDDELQRLTVQMSISTHALTWRATSNPASPAKRNPHFYPRPHMEGDEHYRRSLYRRF